LLKRISELTLVDKLVVRRIFAILLVYETDGSMSTPLRNALLQQQSLLFSKTHALIVSFQSVDKGKEIVFDQLTFVRPLRNACTVDQNFLTLHELNVRLLFRWLLARDESGNVINCDFK